MSHPSLKAAVTVFLWDFSDVWEKIWAISTTGAAANRTKGFQQVCKPQQLSSLISVSRLDCHSFSFSFILSIRLSAFTPQTCMFESELLLYLERKLLRSKSSQLKENCCVVRRHLCVFSRLESNMSLFQASVLCDNRLNISVVTSAHMCQSQLHTVQRFLTRVSRQDWNKLNFDPGYFLWPLWWRSMETLNELNSLLSDFPTFSDSTLQSFRSFRERTRQ